MSLNKLKKELQNKANKKKAEIQMSFFKTEKGSYGHGDIFIGITVPEQRDLAKKYIDLPLNDIQKLLDSEIHEHRLVGLFILISKYKKDKKVHVEFYLKNTGRVNNWDLVDISAAKILGDWLIDKDRSILYKLARSGNLWEKRISIVSTFAFIQKKDLNDTFNISEILMKDKHDLIHKAVGWMLREAGKKDSEALKKFLKKHYKEMPRTMLRYAIEKFDDKKRKMYLNGEI